MGKKELRAVISKLADLFTDFPAPESQKKKCGKKGATAEKRMVPQCRSVRQGLRLNYKQLERPLPAWHGGGLLSATEWLTGEDEEWKLTWRPEGRERVAECGRGSISKLADLPPAAVCARRGERITLVIFETKSGPGVFAPRRLRTHLMKSGWRLIANSDGFWQRSTSEVSGRC